MLDPMKTQGVFSWYELMTDDVEGAKAFYGELFGWKFESNSNAGMEYTMAKIGGNEYPIAGIFDKKDAMVADASAIPPHWGNYVTVTDVDATAKKVQELNGNIIVPPTDIPGIGRFSVIQDPQGAVISIIQYESCDA